MNSLESPSEIILSPNQQLIEQGRKLVEILIGGGYLAIEPIILTDEEKKAIAAFEEYEDRESSVIDSQY